MTELKNISMIKEANIYFDGKVTSRAIVLADGSKQTLGVMLPGEYTFNTEDKELMEIISGELEVKLPETNNWQLVKGGDTFYVPAKSEFTVNVKHTTDYCCSFIKE